MALFQSNDKKEALKAQKAYELMCRYGLQELSDPRDIETVRQIANDLAGAGLAAFSAVIGGNPGDQAKISYLQAIMEQNWIIIRQLDKLNRK